MTPDHRIKFTAFESKFVKNPSIYMLLLQMQIYTTAAKSFQPIEFITSRKIIYNKIFFTLRGFKCTYCTYESLAEFSKSLPGIAKCT